MDCFRVFSGYFIKIYQFLSCDVIDKSGGGDEETKLPVTYYERFPAQIKGGTCIIIDPMLATGGSTIAAIDLLKDAGAAQIVVICIVTCQEGLALVESVHPDVPIYTASIDERLDENKYIVPGLGDAGDRLFGTPH